MGVKKAFAVFLLFLIVAGVLAYLFVPETLWELIASVTDNETASEILGFNPYGNTTGNATRTPRPPPDASEQYSFLRDGYWDNPLVEDYWRTMRIVDRVNESVAPFIDWAGKILLREGGPTPWHLRLYKEALKEKQRKPNATIDYGTYYEHPAQAFYGNVTYEYLFNIVPGVYNVGCYQCSYTSGAWYFKYKTVRFPEYGVEIRVLAWRHVYTRFFTRNSDITGLTVLVYTRIYNMTAFIAKVADLTYLTGPQMGGYLFPSSEERATNIYYGGARFYSDIGEVFGIGYPYKIIYFGNITKWRIRHALIVFDLTPIKGNNSRRLYHYAGKDYPVEVIVAMDEPLIETPLYAVYKHEYMTRLPLMPADELYWAVAGGPAFGLALNFALPANSTWPDWVKMWNRLVDQLKGMNGGYSIGTPYGTYAKAMIIPMFIHFYGVCVDWARALDEFTANALGFPVAFYSADYNETTGHVGGVLILPREAVEALNRTMPDYVAKHVNATMLDLDHDGYYEYGVFGVLDSWYKDKSFIDKIFKMDAYPPYGFFSHLSPLASVTVYKKIYDLRHNVGIDQYIAGLPAIYHPPWYKEFVNYTVDAYQYDCPGHERWQGCYCVEAYNPWEDYAKWKIRVHYRPPIVYINQSNPKYQFVVRSPWVLEDGVPVGMYVTVDEGVNFSYWLVHYPVGHDSHRNRWDQYRIPPETFKRAIVDLYIRYWSHN